MMKWKHILTVLLLFVPVLLLAQNDTLKLSKQDSILKAQLNKQLNKVEQLAAERLSDSLRRADLELQMAGLAETEKLKRADLLNELKALKQRDSIKLVRQKQKIDSLKKLVKGYPVIPFRDTLFFIYTRQGSFMPKDRATAVSDRIKNLADEYKFSADSLKIVPTEQTVDILFKGNLLISVSEQDALWENLSKEKLASSIKSIIASAVDQYRDETSWATLIKEALLALLVILIVTVVIYGINRLFKWILSKNNYPANLVQPGHTHQAV